MINTMSCVISRYTVENLKKNFNDGLVKLNLYKSEKIEQGLGSHEHD